MTTKKNIIQILFILSVFILCSSVYAKEIIQLNRPKVKVSVSPEETITGYIEVTNREAKPEDVKVYAEDWLYASYDGSKEFKPAGSTELSANNFITFAPTEFSVSPGGIYRVNYTIKVPKGTKGGYYSVLFFESLFGELPQERQEGVVIPVAVRIGSLFYVEVEGTVERTARLENIKIGKEEESGPIMIKADFINTGNVDIDTQGSYYIIDKEGLIYSRGEFNHIYTFPQDIAKLEAACDDVISSGVYDLIITLDLGKGETLVEEIRLMVTLKDDKLVLDVI